jgi:hypothetical protein
MSYSQAAMDDKLQEMTEKFDEKFDRMESIQSNMDSKMDAMCELLLNLKNPPSASQPQPSLRSVEMKTPTKQHSLMQSRQSMHIGPAQDQYEEANFRHRTQRNHAYIILYVIHMMTAIIR